MARRGDTSQFLDWDTPRFLYEVRRRGLTWAKIGAMAEPPIKADGIRQVIKRRWPRAETVVAKALGVPAEVIWPSRYPSKKAAA